ncbi:uncharacterized protein GGS22DRAFT_124771 [Annulohypoxylon maeteangense]|uniref:uncharacterized protein n=1 Tax=Annulohypoxylon maeteangense TaxID=1927788 RepID=UPI00200833AC|nr:uncharacterized protein GGS22DRAFT_124771 [Annulohypoxylon maeteangense]KAI0886138.1 hypothetical protein GGS22DRAFT_124771 [Annulohypoxylon maeteangense]
MLNQLVLAALLPAIMASPIAQRSQSAVPSGMGGVMYHNNIPTAAAKAMDMDPTSMKNAAVKKISGMGADVPHNEPKPNVKHSGRVASQTKNHARAPEPTVFVSPTQVVGRQINTTMLNDISKNAVSFATGIAESIASGLANLPPSKRSKTPVSSSSAPQAAATAATNATSAAQGNCDCIGACSDIEGKSKQMKCIKECAKTCDGDDDSKKKKDPVKDLLGSLGLREIIPAEIEHAKRPKPKPIKISQVTSEEAFEECMKNCKTHNCQHSSVGLSIDQCGKTSCEETCAKHRKGMSGKKISKKGLESADSYPAAKPAPKPAPKPPKHQAAAAKEEEEYESCMQECKTHNCQHSSVGLSVDQCGDTFCADGCAKYKKAEKFAAEKMVHKTYLRAVDGYPTKPEPKPKHDISAAGKENEEFELCLKECRTHNCQHSGVGLSVDQCGDTACADACAGYKHTAAGVIHGGMHAREQLNYPTSPKPVPQPARVPTPKPALKSHPHPTHKATIASENEEFEACLKECKTHNCQHSGVGLSIDQCGDTACADACAGYKKSAKAGSKSTHKRQVQPVPEIEALPAVPAVAPLPAVEPLPAVQAVAPLPALPNVAVAPNAAPAPNKPATPVTASPAGPGSHPPPDVPVAAKKGSEDYEACMKQCKSHNCQHTSVGLETERCGKTSCEEECASYHEADAAVSGKEKVKIPGAKLVPNPVAGPPMLAVPNVHDVPVAEGHASQEFEDCVKKCMTRNCEKTGVGLGTEQCGDTSCEEKCAKGRSEAAFRAHGKA